MVRMLPSALLGLLCLLCLCCALTMSCPLPGVCTCTPKTVTCDGKNGRIDYAAFLAILQGLPSGTESLTIEYAKVVSLTKQMFTTAKDKVDGLTRFSMRYSNLTKIEPLAFESFVHLTSLDLSHNTIMPENRTFQELTHLSTLKLENAFKHEPTRTFPVNIFHRVEKLKSLDLSFNGITRMPRGLFDEVCQNLVSLNLANNDITHIENDTFKNCDQLTNLVIKECKLVQLDNNTFKGLTSLKQLDLTDNDLHTLTVANLEPVKNATILLSKNPWNCQCEMIFLLQWLTKEGVTLEIICKWPQKLSNKRLMTLDAYKLGCEDPKVTEISKNPLTIFEDGNGTFVVEAIGLPYVDVDCQKQNSDGKMFVSYRHSIHIDDGIEHHYTNIQIDFLNAEISDTGNITCTVKNLLGEDHLMFVLYVQKDDGGRRLDIVIFVAGIMVFVITVALLIACLNIRNKKRAVKEAKLKQMTEMRGHENHAFEKNLKPNYRRRDSIGYFPSSGPMKNALTETTA